MDLTFACSASYLEGFTGLSVVAADGVRLDLRKPAVRDHTLRYLGVVYALGDYDEVSPPEWVGYSDGSWWLQRGEKVAMFAPSGADVHAVPALDGVRECDDLPALFHVLIFTLEHAP